jgi:hypothetical protein
MLFAERFDNSTRRRFMIFSVGSLGQDPIVTLQYRARTYMAQIAVQLLHTTDNFDYLVVGQRRCANYYRKDAHETQCFDYGNCDMTHQAFSGGEAVRFSAGPQLSRPPTCTDNIFLFGQFAIEGFLATQGTYYVTRLEGPFLGAAFPFEPTAAIEAGRVRLLGHRLASDPRPYFRLVKESQIDDPDEMILSAPLPLFTCDHEEIRSFNVIRGVGTGQTASCVVALTGGGSRPCSTAADFHFACATSVDCVGYTTKLVGKDEQSLIYQEDGNYDEQPFMMHTRTFGFIPEKRLKSLEAYGERIVAMMYYEKLPPKNRSCTFRVEGSQYGQEDFARVAGGNTSIYLLQTAYTVSSTKIYVTIPGGQRMLKKECGLLQPFIRASDAPEDDAEFRYGQDNQCGSYSLCYETGYLPPGTLVDVEASHDMLQGRCNYSLSTIVNYTRADYPRPVEYNVTSRPSLNVSGLGFVSREVYLPFTDESTSIVKIFTSNATDVVLKVVQTGWECKDKANSCPKSAIEFGFTDLLSSYKAVAATCGGLLGFREGPGEGSQCSVQKDCTENIVHVGDTLPSSIRGANHLINATGFTGVVTITVDMSVLKTYVSPFLVPDYCRVFSAFVYIKSAVGEKTSDAFPLALKAIDTMNPILAVNTNDRRTLGLPTATLAYNRLRVPDSTSGVSVRPLFSFGPFGEVFDTFSVGQTGLILPTSQDSVVGTMRAHLSPNITLACVADHIAASRMTCVLPMPLGANWASVRVLQNDFASNVMTVTVRSEVGRTHTLLTRSCGSGNSFRGKAGLRGSCDKFYTCMETYIDQTSAGATVTGDANYDFATIEITVPNTVQPQGCSFSFAALVEFRQQPNRDLSQCSGYICAADRKCISNESLCDGGVSECSDSADEAMCGLFLLTEVGHSVVNMPGIAYYSGITSALACRRKAVWHRGGAFLWEDEMCTVYSDTAVAISMLSSPSQVLVRSQHATAEFYAVIPYKSLYRRCSRYLHCNARGVLSNAETLKDGDQCVCICDPSFAGADCSSMRSMAVVAEYLAIMPVNKNAAPVAIQAALAGGNDGIKVSVLPFRPFNSTHTAVPFTFTSFDLTAVILFRNNLFTPAYLNAVNLQMSTLRQKSVAFIFAVDGVSVQTSYGRCTATGDHSFTCGSIPPRKAALKSLGISTYGVMPPFTVRLTIGGSSSSTASSVGRRFSAQEVSFIEIPCNGTNVVGTGDQTVACTVNNCLLPQDIPLDITNISVVTPSSFATVPAASDPLLVCQTTRLELLSSTNVSFVQQRDGQEPKIVSVSIGTFLIGGAILIACFAIFALLGYCFARAWTRTLRGTRRGPMLRMKWRMTDLPLWIRAVLTHMTHTSSLKRFNLQQVVITFVLFVVVSIGIAGAMFVLWETSKGIEATFRVGLTYYDSPSCAGGDISTLPFKAAFFDAIGTKCAAFNSIGLNDGPAYGRAQCTLNSKGGYALQIAVGRTPTECAASPFVDVSENSCVFYEDIVSPDFALLATGYVLAKCYDIATAGSVALQFANVAPTVNASTVVECVKPALSVALNNPVAAMPSQGPDGTPYYSFPTIVDGTVTYTTSTSPNRLASIATREQYIGSADAKRVVLQPPEPAGAIFSVADVTNLTTPLETAARPDMNYLPLDFQPKMVPRDNDYPIGFSFNEFTTSNQLTGSDASIGAHRYFGLLGTSFDVGHHFGPAQFEDDLGFSMSMWLRVDRTTQGFAFVMADHLEDTSTRTSPVVERLMAIARDGEFSTQPWFDRSFRVYASLYVQGSDKSLNFMFADPRLEDPVSFIQPVESVDPVSNKSAQADQAIERVTTLGTALKNGDVMKARWDTEELGVDFIFNGGWHHVTVVIKNENKRSYATLYVDGDTSTRVGWRKCLARRPSPVTSRSKSVITDDLTVTKATTIDEAVLYVGYFNGGVRGLQFDNEPKSPDFYVRQGSHAIRVKAAVRTNTLRLIAYAMLIAFVVAIASAVLSLYRAVTEYRTLTAEEEIRMRKLWASQTSRLFPGGIYLPVDLQFAINLFGSLMPTSAVKDIVEYCIAQPLEVRADGRTLAITAVRVIWLAGHPDSAKALKTVDDIRACYPTSSEWNEWVAEVRIARAKFADKGGDVIFEADMEAPEAVDELPAGDGSSLGGAFTSILTTLQAMAVYSVGWKLPEVYRVSWKPVFNILNLDFFQTFEISAMARPIMLFAIGCFCLMILSFILAMDQRSFYQRILRFMARRNRKLGLLREQTEVLRSIVDMLEEADSEIPCPYQYTVNTLGRNLRGRLHEFAIEPKRPSLHLTDADGMTFDTHRSVTSALDLSKTEDGEVRKVEKEEIVCNVTVVDARTNEVKESLKDVIMPEITPYCPEHPECMLELQPQSLVAPYDERRGCCAMVGGQRCGKRVGMMYVCKEDVDEELWKDRKEKREQNPTHDFRETLRQFKEKQKLLRKKGSGGSDASPTPSEKGGEDSIARANSATASQAGDEADKGDDGGEIDWKCQCNYALCQDHFQAPLGVRLRMTVWKMIDDKLENGISFIICKWLVLTAIGTYTPLMQTSVMIASCHPYFQCEFPHCWSKIDQTFATTVYCALLAIVVIGIGMPGYLLVLIRERMSAMSDLWNDTRYRGRFLNDDPHYFTPEEAILRAHESKANWLQGIVARRKAPVAPDANEGSTDIFENAVMTRDPDGRGFTDIQIAPQPAGPADDASNADALATKRSPSNASSAVQPLPPRLVNGSFVPTDSLTDGQRKQRRQELVVRSNEYSRWEAEDETLLHEAYETLKKEFLYMGPVMMIAKFSIIVPAITMEDSVGQLSLIATGIVLYGIWMELVQPYRSRWIAFIDLAGICHSIAQIGLQGYFSAQVNDKDVEAEMGTAMMSVTLAYVVIAVTLTVGMLGRPPGVEVLASLVRNWYFTRFALNNFIEVPVYLAPVKGHISRRMRDVDEDTEASSVASASDIGESSSDDDDGGLRADGTFDASQFGADPTTAEFVLADESSIRFARRAAGIVSDGDDEGARAPAVSREPFAALRQEPVERKKERRQRRLQAQGLDPDQPEEAQAAAAPAFPRVDPSVFT